MNVSAASSVDSSGQYDCLVFPVFGSRVGSSTARIHKALAAQLNLKLAKSGLANNKTGHELFECAFEKKRLMVVLVQFDRIETITIKTLRRQLTNVIGQVSDTGCQSLLLCWSQIRPKGISSYQYYQLLAQYIEMTEYQLPQHDTKKAHNRRLTRVVFFDPAFKQIRAGDQSIKTGKAVAKGINLCKSISNLPANICTPSYIARQSEELAKCPSVTTTVIDESGMEKLNMNCILAVSKGSHQPAKLAVVNYTGTDPDRPPVVLIGKGVTFDSGGYSIKSAPGMHEMKFDMCGAASVMGTIHAISLLKLPVNAVALLPCSENLINGGAFKPGDVLSSMSGQTVEILSTDAEGRLLLADALTYARRFKPALVVDVATLTGAAITALGYDISAIMSNDKKLSRQLCNAGKMCHDYIWPLPIWEDYSEVLNSNFADTASSAGRTGNTGAGAIVAGCFLSRFTKDYRWAHLDVAGTAWHRGKQLRATGRPVALLTQFLINYSKKPF